MDSQYLVVIYLCINNFTYLFHFQHVIATIDVTLETVQKDLVFVNVNLTMLAHNAIFAASVILTIQIVHHVLVI